MHEARPVAARCILGGFVLGGLCAAFYPDRLSGPVGVEQVFRLLFAGLLFVSAVTIFISLAFRLPRLRWTENELIFSTLFGSTLQLRLTDFGPATPYNTYYRGIRTANLLLFRPISGGKIISLSVSGCGYNEAQLAELADRINKTRGMPTGSTDAQALMETRNSGGLSVLALLLGVPVVLLLYFLLFRVF